MSIDSDSEQGRLLRAEFMARVKEVAVRLGAIQSELANLDGASAERYQLLKEQDELREEASRLAVDVNLGRSTEDLQKELAALRRQRKELFNSHSGYAMSPGGSGPAGGAWVALTVSSNGASGVDAINARIARIGDVLASRRSNSVATPGLT